MYRAFLLAPLVAAFNFGGINIPVPTAVPVLPTALPSIPSLPTALPMWYNSTLPTVFPSIPSDFQTAIPDFKTAYPSVPEYPSIPDSLKTELPTVPIDFKSAYPTIPVRESRLPMITVPSLPSIDLKFPSIDAEGPLATIRDVIASELGNIAHSAGFELPSIDVRAVPSILEDLKGDGDPQRFVDSYLNKTNKNFTIPKTMDELRNTLMDRGSFNLSRATDILDRLSGGDGKIHESIRLISSLVAGNTTEIFTRSTAEFTYHATRLRERVEQTLNVSGLQLRLPPLDLENRTLSVLQYTSNPYAALSGEKLNSKVVSIMIADLAGNETTIRGLQERINFTIPLVNVSGSDFVCAYWNEVASRWSTDGCELTELLPAEATCSCDHLTDFAVIANAPSSNAPISVGMATPGLLVVSGQAEQTKNVPIGPVLGGTIGGLAALIGVAAIVANIMYRNDRRRRRLTVKPEATVVPSPLHAENV